MEKNKIRKGDEKEWWAWVRLSFKLRWSDLWVSGERVTVQTGGAARAEALQHAQPAAGCPWWSAWTEQGLHPQKPGRTCSFP